MCVIGENGLCFRVYGYILPNHVGACSYFSVLHASPFDFNKRMFSVCGKEVSTYKFEFLIMLI